MKKNNETEKNNKKPNRSVSFDSLLIREYIVEPGNHPSCRSGPPLQLSWNYSQRPALSVETFEKLRNIKHGTNPRKKVLRLEKAERELMLKDEGYSDEDIQRISKSHVREQLMKNSAYQCIKKNATWDTITTSRSSGKNNPLSVPSVVLVRSSNPTDFQKSVKPYPFSKSLSRPIINQTKYHHKNSAQNAENNGIHVVIQPNKKLRGNGCNMIKIKNPDLPRNVSSSSCDSSSDGNSMERRFTNMNMSGKNGTEFYPMNDSKKQSSIKIVVQPRPQQLGFTSSMSSLSTTN